MTDRLVALLDLDGTLIDSAPGIVAGLQQALIAVGEPVPNESVLRTWIGPPIKTTLQTRLAHRGREAWALANAAFREYFDVKGAYQSAPFHGIPEALSTMSDLGLVIVVVTNKPHGLATLALDQHGLAPHVEDVFAPHDPNDTSTTKVGLMATALARTRAASAVAAGDRADDMHAAAAHRLACVGVAWGYGTAVELSECEAIVRSPSALPEALQASQRRVVHALPSSACRKESRP